MWSCGEAISRSHTFAFSVSHEKKAERSRFDFVMSARHRILVDLGRSRPCLVDCISLTVGANGDEFFCGVCSEFQGREIRVHFSKLSSTPALKT